MIRPLLFALLLTNLTLLLPPANGLRVAGSVLLLFYWPASGYVSRSLPLAQFVWQVAGSFLITLLTTLFLHYLPGPISTVHLVLILNGITLLPYFYRFVASRSFKTRFEIPMPTLSALPLILIMLSAAFLRLTNLGYSEFQGDEALAMISAAEMITGQEDALFRRSKGPGEVLLPAAMWLLTGTISEGIARLPFALASIMGILAIYLIGTRLQDERLGWLAAGVFALQGFMVAFGRIVQYQAVVVWFSSLTFLLLLVWREHRKAALSAGGEVSLPLQDDVVKLSDKISPPKGRGAEKYPFWRDLGGLHFPLTTRHILPLLSGCFLGAGLLAHYDAILVAPALGWLILSGHWTSNVGWVEEQNRTNSADEATVVDWAKGSEIRWASFLSPTYIGQVLTSLTLLLFGAALTALPFYLPYRRDPQADRTGDYLSDRIGDSLRNNLPDFFHFNSFYSSFYYVVLTSLLVFIALLLWQKTRVQRTAALVLGLAVLVVVAQPDILQFSDDWDWAILPFAGLLGLTWSAQPLGSARQALLVWLAVPFLGYNFVVALGLTHIYTIVPAWALLAGWSLWWLTSREDLTGFQNLLGLKLGSAALFICVLIMLGYQWHTFVRHDIEFWQDYPDSQLALFWTPYTEPPKAGFFGFAHRAGWKAIGQKITDGTLSGDYSSNEEPEVTTWYTRGAPRACDPQPEFYFIADDLVDEVDTPQDLIASAYQTVGTVDLNNGKQMVINQLKPTSLNLGGQADQPLADQFDQSAWPEAFVRSGRGAHPLAINFSHLIKLIGYDIDTQRAYPGGRVPVTLYWQALQDIPQSYQVFTHLESDATGLIAQADGVPVCWQLPTDQWRPGQIIADQRAISLNSDTPLGDYPLQIGLYLQDTFVRLDWLDVAGNPAGVSVILTTVTIEERP